MDTPPNLQTEKLELNSTVCFTTFMDCSFKRNRGKREDAEPNSVLILLVLAETYHLYYLPLLNLKEDANQ